MSSNPLSHLQPLAWCIEDATPVARIRNPLTSMLPVGAPPGVGKHPQGVQLTLCANVEYGVRAPDSDRRKLACGSPIASRPDFAIWPETNVKAPCTSDMLRVPAPVSAVEHKLVHDRACILTHRKGRVVDQRQRPARHRDRSRSRHLGTASRPRQASHSSRRPLPPSTRSARGLDLARSARSPPARDRTLLKARIACASWPGATAEPASFNAIVGRNQRAALRTQIRRRLKRKIAAHQHHGFHHAPTSFRSDLVMQELIARNSHAPPDKRLARHRIEHQNVRRRAERIDR